MFPEIHSRLLFVGVALAVLGSVAEIRADAWDAHVRPLLESKCLKCHGGAKQKGGLDLRSAAMILKGGETGPAVVAGKPDESLLYELIQPAADPHMPPKGDPLTSGETLLLRSWIESLDANATTSDTPGFANSPTWSPPSGSTASEAIDLRLAAGWERAGVTPAPKCDDATFARRAYIDLAGRIPTVRELQAFTDSDGSDKRGTLVEKLLASPEFPKHMTEIFNAVFLRREGEGKSDRGARESNRWLDYLHWAFSNNRPWDRMAVDLLMARPAIEEETGASWFLAEKRDDPNTMATETARALLGKQIECAQCHDHPVSPEIEHRHYWGMVAFFNRTYRVKTPQGIRVAEAATGGYSEYKDLGGKSFEAELAFLNGSTFPEKRNEGPDSAEFYMVAPPESYFEALASQDDGKKKKKDKKKRRGPPEMEIAPVPKQSRRELLTQAIVEGNPDFAAAAVNRFWAYLTGRGLVHPVDQMDSAHPPSHPQLLAWLAVDFSDHGYDIRRLIGSIMASKAYQLDSVHPAQRPPLPQTFARMVPKPLSAEALCRSLLVASGKTPGLDGTFDGVDEDAYRRQFVKRFPALFPEVTSPRVGQGLFFTNNPVLDDFTASEQTENLAGEPDPVNRTHQAFLQVLGRAPDPAETERTVAYFGARADRIGHATQQVLWSLMASSEFRFNR